MSGGDSDSKWACGRCTYLNYNNSSRCTMCYNSKPHHLIIPTTTAVSATAAGSGGFVTTTNDEVITTPPPDAPYPITGDKWACIECTYLNYPRSIRCCQCYSQRATDAAPSPDQTPDSQALSPCSPPHTNRSSHSPHSHNTTVIAGHSPPPRSPHHHPTTPPKATTNTNTQSSTHNKSRQSPTLKSRQSPPLKSRQSPPLKSRQSPPLKFHHQSSPKGRRSPPRQFSHKQIQQSARVPPQQQQVSPNKVAAKNRVNHETQTSPTALVEHMLPHKWSCSSCTYENWPRSSRCIMCATPKSMSDKNQGACKGNSPPYTNTNICSTTASKNNCRASSPMNTVSFDQLSKRNLSSPCSKSIGINELATSDVNNSTVSTNVSERRTAPADLQSRFIVSDREESKTCESINLINRNRSLNKDSLPPNSISSNNVDSINVSSSFPRTATVTSISSSSPIITSCSADANATALSVSQTSSPTGNSTTTTNSIGGTTTPSSISVVSVTITSSSNSTSGVPTTTTYSMSGNNGSENTSVRGRGAEGAMALNNYETERLLRKLRRRLMDADLAFLNACIGVVEGNYEPVERYLSSGGDPMRNLTSADIKLLARPSAFDEGHTLVHLAIRFGREDLLDTILSGINGGGCGVKRVPCYVAPDLAADIRRTIAASLRQRRDTFPCYCVSEFVTYSLPPEVEMLGSSNAQDRLWDELLDRDAQKQLEEDSPIINWSLELTDRLASRLYALWNRTAGDCLLDSVLQATWGVFDRDNCLRRALASSISDGAHTLFPRWKEYERLQARMLNYAVPENQVLEEWAELLCLATQPGSALDQLHIFVLAHILRRPIVVYGVKYVKSFRGEDLGYARFEGVYLPLLWEPNFCCKSPIALGYTRGHFCALVPICPQSIHAPAAGAILEPGESQMVFLPLMSHDAKLLPVHFITQQEVGCEAVLLREWLDVCQSETGLLVAQQKLHKKPLPVAQMTEEWLNYYRTMAQMEGAPFSRPITSQGYSSDGDSEEE